MAAPEIAQAVTREGLPRLASPDWGQGCTSPQMYKVVPNTVGMPQQSRMTRCSGPLSQDLVDKKMGLIVPLKGGSEVQKWYS